MNQNPTAPASAVPPTVTDRSHAKPWWKPFAEAVRAEARAGRPCTLFAIADLIADGAWEFGTPREEVAAAVRAAAGKRGGIKPRLPDRRKGALARSVWRHLTFVFGHDTTLTGLFLSRYEAGDAQDDLAQDLAFVLGELAGRNVGVTAWRRAFGGAL